MSTSIKSIEPRYSLPSTVNLAEENSCVNTNIFQFTQSEWPPEVRRKYRSATEIIRSTPQVSKVWGTSCLYEKLCSANYGKHVSTPFLRWDSLVVVQCYSTQTRTPSAVLGSKRQYKSISLLCYERRFFNTDWRKTNVVAFFPQVNYTDREAKTVPSFAGRAVSPGQRNGSSRPSISVF
jgi:hypothetical protein